MAQPTSSADRSPQAGLPVWWDERSAATYPPLSGDLHVDIAVVGAGLTGLATAAALADSGLRIAIVERDRVGSGETSRSTAHATQVVDTRYTKLARDFGKEEARRVAASQRDAIERIATLDRDLGLDADVRRVPAFVYTERRDEVGELEEECRRAAEAGLPAQMTRAVPLPFATGGGFRVEDQARFDPVAFATGLARALVERGVLLRERTPVLQVTDGAPCRVETPHGTITARAVVVAAHVPINTRLSLHTSIIPTRTYALSITADGEVPDALFWDNDSPYHYLRWRGGRAAGRVLVVGGADHRVGDEAAAATAIPSLTEYVRARFGDVRVTHAWSGQILEPTDGLPYIGRTPGDTHVYVATAYSGNGTTFAMTAASILADAILGRQSLRRVVPRDADGHGGCREGVREAQRHGRCGVRRWPHSGQRRARHGAGPGAPGRRLPADAGRDDDGRRQGTRRPAARALASVPAHGVQRALEHQRAVVGLPLSRIALRHRRVGTQRPRDAWAGSGVGLVRREVPLRLPAS